MSKYAKRTDDNQPIIVEALRKAGAFVQIQSAAGHGVPDLLAGYRGLWFVLEVKDGGKPQCERKLTRAQEDWLLRVKNAAPVHVVETVEQALAVVRGQA